MKENVLFLIQYVLRYVMYSTYFTKFSNKFLFKKSLKGEDKKLPLISLIGITTKIGWW